MDEVTRDFHVLSSLEEIESSMRSANALDKSKFYGPSMCAFAILDQIGTCYGRRSVPGPVTQTSIKRALHYFCGIDAVSSEAQHLYAFRNGQVHDAAYVNQDRKGNWYFFRNNEQLNSVIELPNNPWNGSAATIGPDTTTLISREKLVKLASDTVKQVANIYFDDRADLEVRVPKATLIHKYLLWVRRKARHP